MKLYFFILICMVFSCKNHTNSIKQSSCNDIYEIQYDKSKKYLLSKKEKDKNYFIIYIENNFNDKLKININKKIIFDKQVITNNQKPDDYSERIIYKMDGNDKNIMNLQSELNKACIEIPLDKKYRIIYLFYYQNKFIVRFSNQIRIN
ncbi:hypothetical protein SD427_14540 [Chryseobacterium sp. JJR-5R]|uniref:hypothetical protein n=1 Tax=Chryseobacterium sp. JJR-5R TaxID=3093923 RepID=UPI002A75CE2C|nr:hypothetical protein [Chryseobacterium sp. JJR-5R]WPO81975.1 hypothetical protein SD427_14540 [Chryseobacterium sp. JJR-5R]